MTKEEAQVKFLEADHVSIQLGKSLRRMPRRSKQQIERYEAAKKEYNAALAIASKLYHEFEAIVGSSTR